MMSGNGRDWMICCLLPVCWSPGRFSVLMGFEAPSQAQLKNMTNYNNKVGEEGDDEGDGDDDDEGAQHSKVFIMNDNCVSINCMIRNSSE